MPAVIGFVLVCGIVAGGAFAFWPTNAITTPLPPKQEATKKTKLVEDAKPIIPIRIMASDLITSYRENEIAADLKYKHRILEVEGVIGVIGKLSADERFVSLIGGPDDIWSVMCNFSRNEDATLSALKPGTMCTVRGKCSGVNLGVVLTHCEFAPLSDAQRASRKRSELRGN